jgi:hypothetical protein
MLHSEQSRLMDDAAEAGDFKLAKRYKAFVAFIERHVLPLDAQLVEAKAAKDFDKCLEIDDMIQAFPKTLAEFESEQKS